jgi:hypothetical protein
VGSKVALIGRLWEGEVDMLRARTDDTDLVALLAFYSREIATEYLTFSEELQGEGWDVVEVDLRISPRSVPPSVSGTSPSPPNLGWAGPPSARPWTC